MLKDIDTVYMELAEEAENACRYIFDAIQAGDKMRGLIHEDDTYEVVFEEADGERVSIGITCLFKLTTLLRREPVIK